MFVSFFWISDPGSQATNCVNWSILHLFVIVDIHKRSCFLFCSHLLGVDKGVAGSLVPSHFLYVSRVYPWNVCYWILVVIFIHVKVYRNVVIFLMVVPRHAGPRSYEIHLCIRSWVRCNASFLVNFIAEEAPIVKVAIIGILNSAHVSRASLRLLKT